MEVQNVNVMLRTYRKLGQDRRVTETQCSNQRRSLRAKTASAVLQHETSSFSDPRAVRCCRLSGNTRSAHLAMG